MSTIGCAILGSGNIGTDLLMKIRRQSRALEIRAIAGIDPASDGIARARAMGVPVTDGGLDGLMQMREFEDVRLVFDATSASSHKAHYAKLAAQPQITFVDLTPAALGPYVVPVVNAELHLDARAVNLVSCGGQATIPIVAAISRCAPVHYAEIVASIASRSAGPGTRANIDEFTATTARGLEQVGGAARGKAIIVLNPANPPMVMRNTVFALSEDVNERRIAESIADMVAQVQAYVPGYRLKQEVIFDRIPAARALHVPGHGRFHGLKTSVFLQIIGAGDYLPAYSGNLDIMTSAALATGERLAKLKYS